MNNKPDNTRELLRRALASQVELGIKEVIISRRGKKRPESDGQSSAPSVQVGELFPEISTELLGHAEFESLDSHKNAICNCLKCPLGATRTKFVYGVGNPNAKIVFIGEGPGREEDLKGEPFVGPAGKLLDKILAAINFDRSQVYIANVVKCRPPENRQPLPAEMDACFPYLLEQLRLIKPKLICALGRVAAMGLLKTSASLGNLRGRWHEFKGMELLVTYHPAALLRNPDWKKNTWEDMKKLRARYDELVN
ncbi:MAG: uracil-DNA glycosylase [Candidatus Zixiibacteriota bacterium]